MKIFKKIKSKFELLGLLGTLKFIFKSKIFNVKNTQYKRMLNRNSKSARFHEIYKNNLWGSKESGSGDGSELAYTEGLRTWLIDVCKENHVKQFVDAACGDFNWMREVLPHLEMDYKGFDIVESVIQKNNTNFSTTNISFEVADICKDLLPSCDILMVRDCLFHLSFDDINQTLKNISRVDYKFLITTSHMTDVDYVNSDIKSGDFRWLDISKWPLNFEPKYVFDRFSEPPQGGMNRDIIMYRKEHVPTEMMQK